MLSVIRYLTLGFRDLFDRKVLLVTIFPFILTSFLFAGETLLAIFWAIPELESLFAEGLTNMAQTKPWLASMMQWFDGGLVDVIADILLGIGFVGLLMIINVFLAILLIGVFFTEQLIAKVNDSHYHVQLQPFGTLPEIIWFAIKALGKFLLLFLLFSPLYFVPGLNVLALALPAFLFLKSTVLFDVASQSITREQYRRILRENKLFLYILTIPLYLLIYVPFINIFSYIYAFLVVTHFVLDQLAADGENQRADHSIPLDRTGPSGQKRVTN